MNFLALLLDTAPSETSPAQNLGSILMTVLPLVLIFVVFYFFMIRPQRKQQKEAEQMRNSIAVGDRITTIGGIVGTVRQIKDDGSIYVIETGSDNDKITVHKWAVQSKDTISE